MRAGDFLGDGREGLVNLAVILELVFAQNDDMIFFAVPFTDKLLAAFKIVFIEGLLNIPFDQPIELVLHPDRHAAMFLLLQKVGDLADDNIIALWPPPTFENCCP